MRADDPPGPGKAPDKELKWFQKPRYILGPLACGAVATGVWNAFQVSRPGTPAKPHGMEHLPIPAAMDPVTEPIWVRDEHTPHRMAYQAEYASSIAHGDQQKSSNVRRVNIDVLYRPTANATCAGVDEHLGRCSKTYKLSVFLKNITIDEGGSQEVFYSSKDQAFPPWQVTLTANSTIISFKGDANVSEAMKKDVKETVRLAFPELAKLHYIKVDANGRRSSAPGYADGNTTQMPAPQGRRVNASSIAVQGNGTTTLRVAIEDKRVLNETLPLAQSVRQESTFDEGNGTLVAVNYTSTHVVGDESGVPLEVNMSSMLENITVTQSSTLLSVEPEAGDEGAHNISVINEEELVMDPAEESFEPDMADEMDLPEDNSTAASANASREVPSSASRKLLRRPPVPTSLSSSSVTGDMTSGLGWSGKTTLARTRILSTTVAADATLTVTAMVPKFHPNFPNQLRETSGGMADERDLTGPNDGKLCAGADGTPCQVKCEFDENGPEIQKRQHCAQDLKASPDEKVCIYAHDPRARLMLLIHKHTHTFRSMRPSPLRSSKQTSGEREGIRSG